MALLLLTASVINFEHIQLIDIWFVLMNLNIFFNTFRYAHGSSFLILQRVRRIIFQLLGKLIWKAFN